MILIVLMCFGFNMLLNLAFSIKYYIFIANLADQHFAISLKNIIAEFFNIFLLGSEYRNWKIFKTAIGINSNKLISSRA